MSYSWGNRSLSRLEGVHPRLVELANVALSLSPVDLTIGEGLRTMARQKRLVSEGRSRTMSSRHLTGHAIDVWPIVNGKIPWHDMQPWYDLAGVFRTASMQTLVPVVWGGIWDRELSEIGQDIGAEVAAYRLRYKSERHRSPLFDGPHFQVHR